MKRIVFLAILFISATEFAMERAELDLVFMSAAIAALLWNWLAHARLVPKVSRELGNNPSTEAEVAFRK
jgi:hypothetical protein